MPSFSTIFEWLRDPDNRGAVQIIVGTLAVLVGWATGLFGRLSALFRGKPSEAPKPPLSQTARDGGVNVGGDVHGDVTTRPERRK